MADNPYESREKAAEAAARAETERRESIRSACRHPETKKLIQWIFRRAGLHKSPFAADAEIYRNCGKLELALELRNHIRAALYDCDRTLFFQLTEEE